MQLAFLLHLDPFWLRFTRLRVLVLTASGTLLPRCSLCRLTGTPALSSFLYWFGPREPKSRHLGPF
jgi:hypothetical protein